MSDDGYYYYNFIFTKKLKEGGLLSWQILNFLKEKISL